MIVDFFNLFFLELDEGELTEAQTENKLSEADTENHSEMLLNNILND